jgi:hypothetical protein
MAGEVRQPIDQAKLEKYINDNVPEIKTPIQLKQVCQFKTIRRIPHHPH